MRRAVLLYNPRSGRHGASIATIENIAAALRRENIDVRILATEDRGTGGRQAVQASKDADIIFACGGDGTIHEILQGIAFQSDVALGIIPFGSANVLARHLQLSFDPVRAALQQINRIPRTVPIGKVTFQTTTGEDSRYFVVMAGAGADGALVYNMLVNGKRQFGRTMYYLRAAALFCRARFSSFAIHLKSPSGETQTMRAVSAMAVRVGDLGGLFSPLIQGATVDHPKIMLTIAKTPARLSLPAWFAMSWARLHRWNRFVDTIEVDEFSCSAGHSNAVQVQADGEWLGRTPMTVKIIPDGLRILMPPDSER